MKKRMIQIYDGLYLNLEKAVSDDKFEKVMHEFKMGTLKSSDGKKVTDYKQAVAIAMSESGRAMEKAKKAAIGETATWADGKQYRKISEGNWKLVEESGAHKHSEHSSGSSTSEDVSTPSKLHAKFSDYMQSMSTEHRAVFRGGKMDFEKKRFNALNGKVSLQYKDGKIHVVKNESMEKATMHKYIKRLLNPKGKGYIYFYNNQQLSEYNKTGKIPEQKKDNPSIGKTHGMKRLPEDISDFAIKSIGGITIGHKTVIKKEDGSMEFKPKVYSEDEFYDKDGKLKPKKIESYQSALKGMFERYGHSKYANLSFEKDGLNFKVIPKQESMEKAKSYKYIRRVPKKTGKGYIYFYNAQQYKEYKKNGTIPGEEKRTGGILSGIMAFFGFKDEKQAKEKVNEIYNSKKSELSGVDKKTFSDHMNEYLSNKDKWDTKFNKAPGEKKGSTSSKTEKSKSKSKGESKSESGSRWDTGLIKKIAGFVSGGEKENSNQPEDKSAVMSGKDMLKPRVVSSSKYSSKTRVIIPREVGKKFTDDEKFKLMKMFPGIEKSGNDLVVGPDYSNFDSEFDNAEFKLSQKEEKITQFTERQEKREQDRGEYIKSNQKVSSRIDDLFGKDAMNDFNKSALIRYVNEESKKFDGMANNKLREGLEKIDAIAKDGKIDWEKVKKHLTTGDKREIMSDGTQNENFLDKIKRLDKEYLQGSEDAPNIIELLKNNEKIDPEKIMKFASIIAKHHGKKIDKPAVFEAASYVAQGDHNPLMELNKIYLPSLYSDIYNDYWEKDTRVRTLDSADRLNDLGLPGFDKVEYKKIKEELHKFKDTIEKTRVPSKMNVVQDFFRELGNGKLDSNQLKQAREKWEKNIIQVQKNEEENKKNIENNIKDQGWEPVKINKNEVFKINTGSAEKIIEPKDIKSQFSVWGESLFLIKSPNGGYSVSEKKTGLKVGQGNNKNLAIENAKKQLSIAGKDNFKKAIANGKHINADKMQKASSLLLSELAKAKKMPIGTVSHGRRKEAEGKWVPVSDGKEKGKKEPEKKEDEKKEKPGEKKSSNPKMEIIRGSLKKMATILADALSGKNPNQPTGEAVESTGEAIKEKTKINLGGKQEKTSPKKPNEPTKKKVEVKK